MIMLLYFEIDSKRNFEKFKKPNLPYPNPIINTKLGIFGGMSIEPTNIRLMPIDLHTRLKTPRRHINSLINGFPTPSLMRK